MSDYNQHGGTYLNNLANIAKEDVSELLRKEQTYKGSWKKRGGVGAFMMLARKWDRIEGMIEEKFRYDIFEALKMNSQGQDGTMLAEIRDLRRYLMLVEAWYLHTRLVETSTPGTPEDGGHHEGTSYDMEDPSITSRR